jgi:hypothetical protein
MQTPYAGEAGILLHIFGKFMILKLKFHDARAFNFTYRYIDDVLSINNSRFAEFLPYKVNSVQTREVSQPR